VFLHLTSKTAHRAGRVRKSVFRSPSSRVRRNRRGPRSEPNLTSFRADHSKPESVRAEDRVIPADHEGTLTR
jgi:hypothetical protein